MQQKEWLYFLVDPVSGQSYDLDENDVLVTTPSPVPLVNTPDGWQEKQVQFKRNTTYYGIYRSFTITLRFVRTGARILKKLIYRYGIEAACNLVIIKLDRKERLHKLWYSGEIDLSRANDQQDFFDVNVMEGGLPKYLKANERVVYEIPLNTGSEVLELDGIALQQSTTSSVNGTFDLSALGTHLPLSNIVNSEGVGVATLVRSTSYHNLRFLPDNADINNTHDPIFKAQDDSTLIFTYDFDFKTAYDTTIANKLQDPNLHVKVDLRIFNNGTFKQALTLYESTNDIGIIIGPPIGVFKKLHEVKGDLNIPLQADDEIYLYVYGNVYHGGTFALGGSEYVRFYYIDLDDLSFQPGQVNFGFEVRYPPTVVRAKRADILFQNLVSKLTEGKFTGAAPILQPTGNGNPGTEFRALLIISGDGVRGLDGAVIKTTFEDFFKSMNTVKNIGLGVIDNQVILDEKASFFAGDVVVDLGEVKDLSIRPATEHYCNTFKIGYPDKNYDDINGRNEFNTTQKWTTPITRIVNDLDLLSKYRGDCYGIEFARINLDGKNTTDSESDNDVFIVDAVGEFDASGNVIWKPFRQLFLDVTGILSKDSVFNIDISPKRCLYRHGDYLRSFCFGLDDKELVYQTTDKNSELSTHALSGEIITEKANVPIASLNAAFFDPFNMEFTTKVPLNLVEIISLAKAGIFSGKYKGKPFKGSLVEGSIKPTTLEEQTFKLLAAAGSDLINLV